MMNGIINVYKEKGYTSHDVVAKLRGILKQKKIGHTGTLDPQAEGVLPVCIGNATKLCDLLTDKTKEYEAVLLLGVTTDTQDMTGAVLSEKRISCGLLWKALLEKACRSRRCIPH
jgi:tRNA pseudouridine55 synthase